MKHLSRTHSSKPRLPSARRWWLATALVLAAPAPAIADSVIDWNLKTNQFVATAGGPAPQTRVFAMVQIAVHDALNSIDPRYQSYTVISPADPGASPDAAVARATHPTYWSARFRLRPDRGARSGLHPTISPPLPACPPANADCIVDGEAAGAAAAAAMLALRQFDHSNVPHAPYTLAAGPGVYQPTCPCRLARRLIRSSETGATSRRSRSATASNSAPDESPSRTSRARRIRVTTTR